MKYRTRYASNARQAQLDYRPRKIAAAFGPDTIPVSDSPACKCGYIICACARRVETSFKCDPKVGAVAPWAVAKRHMAAAEGVRYRAVGGSDPVSKQPHRIWQDCIEFSRRMDGVFGPRGLDAARTETLYAGFDWERLPDHCDAITLRYGITPPWAWPAIGDVTTGKRAYEHMLRVLEVSYALRVRCGVEAFGENPRWEPSYYNIKNALLDGGLHANDEYVRTPDVSKDEENKYVK